MLSKQITYNAKQEGLAEGLEKGEYNAKIKTAKHFLKMVLSVVIALCQLTAVAQVVNGTGLSIEEVKELI